MKSAQRCYYKYEYSKEICTKVLMRAMYESANVLRVQKQIEIRVYTYMYNVVETDKGSKP